MPPANLTPHQEGCSCLHPSQTPPRTRKGVHAFIPPKPHPAPGRVLMPSSPPAAPPHQEGHGALVILDHHAKLGRCEEAIRAGAAHIASHTNPTDSLGGGRGAACRGNLGITHAAHIRGSTTHAAHIRGNTMQRTSEVAPCPLCKTPLL